MTGIIDQSEVQRDINDISKTVNEKVIVTPRSGLSYKSLPLAIQEVIETGGFEPFETEALLKASVPVLTKKASYALDTHNIWLWENGAWRPTGLSVLDRATLYADDQIANLFERGTNIFDKTDAIVGKYWGFRNGILSDCIATFSAAKLIIVEPNTEYQTSAFYDQQYCILDKDKKYVLGKASIVADGFKFITPANAKYVGLTVETARISEMMLCKSSEFPNTYIPFTTTIDSLKISTDKVENLFADVKKEIGLNALNILDPSKAQLGYYVSYMTGELGYADGFYACGPYEVKSNTEYQVSENYGQQGAFYNDKLKYISGFASPNAQHKFITPADAKYIKLSVRTEELNNLVIAESSLFPATYVPFGSVQMDGLVVNVEGVKTTEIWVTFDATSTDPKFKFKGKNAVQRALDSITDNSTRNRYAILIDAGMDKLTKATDFIGYRGYPSAVVPKDHVDIIGSGEDKTIIWAELPHNDADVGPSIDGNVYPRALYQTLYDYADDCVIKDITFIAKNIRYTNHIDDDRGANKTHKYENVGFIFKGNVGSRICLGTGTHSGEETYIVGGRSQSDDHIPYACHNNTAFEKPSLWSFKGHNFASLQAKIAIYMQSDGSLLQDKLELIGCGFGGSAYMIEYVEVWLRANTANNYDGFNHAEWQITGYGNEPFLFNNLIENPSLRFKSTAVGVNTSIRFDKTSSAYPILIQNNQSNSIGSLYLDNREFVDQYIVQDGSVGLPAQAWGCKDLSERAAAYDAGIIYTSLAKRLGNCSTVNKVLKVIVSGVTNTITFNKDYSSMTNAQIVAEMNTQISGATIDLVSYGRDYYPELTDVTENAFNASATFIAKGSVVTKSGGTVKLANGNDKIYGVALDDIPVQQVLFDGEKRGQGRVLKRGYIYADRSKAHFVLADNQDPDISTRFKVVNGQLVTDASGKISVDIDDAVISINC